MNKVNFKKSNDSNFLGIFGGLLDDIITLPLYYLYINIANFYFVTMQFKKRNLDNDQYISSANENISSPASMSWTTTDENESTAVSSKHATVASSPDIASSVTEQSSLLGNEVSLGGMPIKDTDNAYLLKVSTNPEYTIPFQSEFMSPLRKYFPGWLASLVNVATGKFLLPTFFIFTLLNRMLLTIQYNYTTYPLFVNLYWQLLCVPFYRLFWNLQLIDKPSVQPKIFAPAWIWWALAGLISLDNVFVSIASNRLQGYGALQVLLSQGRIPISMIITKLLFPGRKYTYSQYIGAIIVIGGILLSILPDLDGKATGGTELIPWIGLYLSHCVPAALYTVGNEKLLEKYQFDEYYMLGCNQYQAIILTLILLVPSAMIDGMEVSSMNDNLKRGAQCEFGITPVGDDPCTLAPYYTHGYIFVNILWNVLGIFVINKAGSNVYFILMTATVPLAALLFGIPGVPSYKPATGYTGGGLIIILIGVIIYKYYTELSKEYHDGFPTLKQWWNNNNSTTHGYNYSTAQSLVSNSYYHSSASNEYESDDPTYRAWIDSVRKGQGNSM